MTQRILVINPNSSQTVTDGISKAVDPLRLAGGPEIECATLAEGPAGIETQAHVESVVLPLQRMIRSRGNDADAFVIACFSDPGLHLARETTGKPVFGIAESGYLTALARGERFGVISILPTSIPRHLRQIRQLGLLDRFAGDRAIGLGVGELAEDDRVRDRMLRVGEALRDRDGAGVLVMGCAGMARFHRDIERAIGIPVVEPTKAAVTMAFGAVCLAA
jgi:allantoin racemase